uniref:Uncharacterized protein n=1 Tax=Oryza punctata TaxID=4537 RepID=A0A0E0M9T8_ORYPU
MVVCSPWNMSYSGGVSRYAHGRETEAARSRERRRRWLLANGGKTPVSTSPGRLKARTVFESTGVLRMSHRGCMREESGGNSPEWKGSPVVRVVGGEDGDAHHVLDRLLLGQKGYGREERGTHRGCTATTAKSPELGKIAEFWAFCAVEWGSERERWLVHSLCSLGIHWAWGTVDAMRGEWEAAMWVPGGVGPTVSERNSKIALEAKSKRVACQGSLEGTQGGFCAARNLG